MKLATLLLSGLLLVCSEGELRHKEVLDMRISNNAKAFSHNEYAMSTIRPSLKQAGQSILSMISIRI
jgi:hypothetical protein